MKHSIKFTRRIPAREFFSIKMQDKVLELHEKENPSKVLPCKFGQLFSNIFFVLHHWITSLETKEAVTRGPL